jgi:NTE family protein
MRRGAWVPLLVVAALAGRLDAQGPKRRPRIGIAFAGGGARGGAHVGVLKVLEELRIPVDYVAGTSIGSIVGALYATGMSPVEMEKVLVATDWDDALRDDQARRDRPYRQKEDDSLYLVRTEVGFHKLRLVLPEGLVSGQKLGYLLRRLTLPASGIADFDRLPIPFRAVATDVLTGERVVLGKGDLPRALRASMALPGFFSPVELDGRLLIDGGSADNLPIDVVREMGADVVIAIDISTPLRAAESLKSFLSIASQTSTFLTRLNVLRQIATLTPNDVLLTPRLEDISSMSFAGFPRAVGRGEAAARAASATLSRLSVTEEEYAAFIAKHRRTRIDTVVHEVRIDAGPGVDARLLRRRIHSAPGPLDWKTVERDLGSLYELGDFGTVDFSVVRDGDRNVLVFLCRPRPPAPDRVRVGLKLDTNFAADSSFGLRVGIYKTHLNSLRGELRTKAEVGRDNGILLELYQPADFGGNFFVSPRVEVRRQPIDAFVGDVRVARVLGTRLLAELDVGASLGALGELRAGVVRARGFFKTEIFTSATPLEATEDVAGVSVRALFDQLDSPAFPRHGWAGGADLLLAARTAGGDYTYDTLRAGGAYVDSFGETTLFGAVTVDAKLGRHDRPYFDLAAAGGFLSLSGLKPGQLTGQNAAVARLIVYHRLARLNSYLGTGVYLGGSIETGNAWAGSPSLSDLRFAGSLFVAADTAIGPLYVGYGRADRGQHSFYLALGLPLN